MNNSGSSSSVIARHDYLPFGEEIAVNIGLRSSSQGYGATDTNRQKYGLTERDDATGLDHTWFRKYDSNSGRWTSPDPSKGSASIADPQSFHRYAYGHNDPVNHVDPSGLDPGMDPDGWFMLMGFNASSSDINFGNYGLSGYFNGHNNGFIHGSSEMQAAEAGYVAQVQATFALYWIQHPQNTAQRAGAAAGAAAVRAAGLLSNTNCSNFIAELISIAADVAGQRWGHLITPSFDPLFDQNGNVTPSYNAYYALNEYERALAGGRVTASGSSVRSGNTITYGTTTGSNISWNSDFYSLSLDDRALMTLHESLHLIPNFSDFVVAGAAHIMATRGTNNPGNTGSFTNQSAASQYINEQIAAHCRPAS